MFLPVAGRNGEKKRKSNVDMDVKELLAAESAININNEEKPAFRRARTKEQIEQRKQEIISAAVKLFEKGGIDAVNFKAISETTSFTRQAIYNYYKTREEILLDVLEMDLKLWENDMYQLLTEYPVLSKEDYAMAMTSIFSDHGLMLELTGLLFNTLELNVRMDNLVEYRKNSVDVYHLLLVSISKYFPTAPREKHTSFASTVFAFAVGLYPMNHMSEKHLEAERLAEALYVYPEGIGDDYSARSTLFELELHRGITLLLSAM